MPGADFTSARMRCLTIGERREYEAEREKIEERAVRKRAAGEDGVTPRRGRSPVPAGEKKVRSRQNLAVATVDPDLRKSGRRRLRCAAPDASSALMRRCAGRVQRRVVRAHSDVDADAQTGILRGLARDAHQHSQRSTCHCVASRGCPLCVVMTPVEAREAGVRTVRTDGS